MPLKGTDHKKHLTYPEHVYLESNDISRQLTAWGTKAPGWRVLDSPRRLADLESAPEQKCCQQSAESRIENGTVVVLVERGGRVHEESKNGRLHNHRHRNALSNWRSRLFRCRVVCPNRCPGAANRSARRYGLFVAGSWVNNPAGMAQSIPIQRSRYQVYAKYEPFYV